MIKIFRKHSKSAIKTLLVLTFILVFGFSNGGFYALHGLGFKKLAQNVSIQETRAATATYDFSICGTGCDTSTDWWASHDDVDQFPFGGNAANRNTHTEASDLQYGQIATSNNTRWTSNDPGTNDETFMWNEIKINELPGDISQIDLTYEGYLANGSGISTGQMYVLKAGTAWEVDANWVAVGTFLDLSTIELTYTRSITSNFSDYIGANGILTWGVFNNASSTSLVTDYVKVFVTYTPAVPPDFSVASTDIAFSNNTPNLYDDVTITSTIHNDSATGFNQVVGGNTCGSANGLGNKPADFTFLEKNSGSAIQNSGTITNWSVYFSSAASTVAKLKIFRLVGGTTYQYIGSSAQESIIAASCQTFTTNINVQAGDLAAIWFQTTDAVTGAYVGYEASAAGLQYRSGEVSSDSLVSAWTSYDAAIKLQVWGPGIEVGFYDGDPDSGGIQIGSNQTISSLAGGGTANAQVVWNAQPAGAHNIYVQVDRGNKITESDETNNKAYKAITVSAPSPPDFFLNSTDIVFSNGSPNVDDDITVTGTIHNNGSAWNSNTSSLNQYYDSTNGASQETTSGIYASQWIAQSFTPITTISVSKVSLYIRCSTINYGSNCGPLTVTLQTDSGGLPSGTTLATTVLPNGTASSSFDWVDVNFSEYPTLTGGNKYWIVAEGVRNYSDLSYGWATDSSTPTYAGGNLASNAGLGQPWSNTAYDAWFRVYGGTNAPILVKFYDGDPDVSGTQISTTQAINSIAGSGTANTQITWPAGAAGAHNIYIHVDRDNKIAESNESNNKDYKAITVASTTPSAPTTLYVGYPSAQSGFSNPTGVTAGTPIFSAVNNHGKAVTAFQIQLTLSADTGYASPIWSSGDITGMTSTANAARTPDIPYGIGNAPTGLLQAGQNYIWRIRTKGSYYSEWSANGTIGMASSGSFTARFYEDKDTFYGSVYVKGGSPDSPEMSYGGWGDAYYNYFHWTNINTLGPSAADTTATNLYLYGNGLKPSNPNIYVRIITASWDEDNLYFNNNPTSTTTDQVLMVNPPAGYFATNITNIYKDWKNATFTNYGAKFIPTTTTGEANGSFRSSDYSWYGSDPYLEVTYTPTPPVVITVGTTGTQVAAMNIPSTNNYVGGAFTFVRDSGSADVTSITIAETGTVNANLNLSNAKLFFETAATCAFNADETQFGTFQSFNSSENATFSGTMPVGTSQVCVYVVLDVGSGASNNQTLDIEISSASDVFVSAGIVSGTFPAAIANSTTLGTSAFITLDQNHYRFRDDSATLDTDSGWLVGQDAIYSPLIKNALTRLRVEIANTGSLAADSYNYRLQSALRNGAACGDDETFTDVPATATTEHWEMVDSSQYADGDNVTVSRLTATGTFTNGKGVEDPSNQTAALSLTNGNYTEFEYAIQATTNAVNSGAYCFRLTNAGSTANFTYSIYPQITFSFLPATGNLASVVFDTGVAKPAYNSILWKGTLFSGMVRFQLAASQCSNGASDYPTCSTGTWNLIGSDGVSCGSAFWYEPSGPNTPLEIGCFSNFNGKQYFKYKIQLCSSSDCVTPGTQTPIVTDVIINWSP